MRGDDGRGAGDERRRTCDISPFSAQDLGLRPRISELVDLHAHVVPGLDDGPRDEDEALAMLRAAVDDGVRTIVATPHAHHARTEDILRGVERLNRLASQAGLNVAILSGCEARIHPDLVERHRHGDLLRLNGSRWLLLELYLHDDWPLHLIERSVDRLRAAGLRPLLAHAERYSFVQHDPQALLPLIECGVPVQINARSLVLREDDIERVTAERLLRQRLAHIIASDAHNARYRPPVVRSALDRVAELADTDYARWMVRAARAVVADEDLRLPEPRR